MAENLRDIIGLEIAEEDLSSLIDKEFEIDEWDLPIISEIARKFRKNHGESYRALEASILFNKLIRGLKDENYLPESKFARALYEIFMNYYNSFSQLTPKEKYYIGPKDEVVDEILRNNPITASEGVIRVFREWRSFFHDLVYKDPEQKRREIGIEPVDDGQHYLTGLRINIENKFVRALQS